MQNNIVYSGLSIKQLISKRKVLDNTYLLKDSLRNIKWKFTDEVCDIAGYPCHRANGLKLDSVYVVAFYTGNFPFRVGRNLLEACREILQLDLPHENVSWIATKVENVTLPGNSVLPPTDGAVINYK